MEDSAANVPSILTPQDFVAHVFAQAGALLAPAVLAYGYKFSPYLTVGPDHLASPDTGEVSLLPALVELDKTARELFGEPLLTDAGFRTLHHEQELAARGYKTSSFVSPHCLGSALDKRALPKGAQFDGRRNLAVQDCYVRAAEKLGLPRPRLGHREYGERFTHVDLVFMLFQPHTKLPHPSTWLELPPRLRAALQAWKPGAEW